MQILSGKKVLIGVSGSIAAYKSVELLRLFIKAGAEVKVLMSEDAKRFITPLSFEALCGNEVLNAQTESWTTQTNHIGFAKWADIFVIAPATANTINKLACGIGDTLLTQVALAYNKKLLISPSANTFMLENFATKENLIKLEKNGVHIIEPQIKNLACKDFGKGAMADPSTIFYMLSRELLNDDFWHNRDVIVTGGGTSEKIDDVRCVSNLSSGKMGEALAKIFYLKGANVTYISAYKNLLDLSLPINHIHAPSAQNMKDVLDVILVKTKSNATKTPYLFMNAAISDYRVEKPVNGKIKKDTLKDRWTLEMIQNPDILASLDKNGIKTIGFKAEVDKKKAFDVARQTLNKKNLDAICLNIINEKVGFGSDDLEVFFITKNKEIKLSRSNKLDIANSISLNSKEI